MTTQPSYREYVADEGFQRDYSEYQRRFMENARECDKATIEFIHDIVADDLSQGKRPAVLDIGCSRGNVLRHLKHALPNLALTGGDMVTSILDENRRDPDLEGIQFEDMNVLELGNEGQFDVVTMSAVLFIFGDAEFDTAVGNIANALKAGGSFIAFDFFHPFEQSITIVENAVGHPDGLPIRFRPYSFVRPALLKHGFANVEFKPFAIQIDLPRPDNYENNDTYTVRTDRGDRMNFRGTLYQPWCHLVAQKAA